MADGPSMRPPADYLCSITQEIMRDPVTTTDGETYERESIERWFAKGKRSSPLTNAALKSTALTPNLALKRSITAFLEEKVGAVKELRQGFMRAERELKALGPAASALLGDYAQSVYPGHAAAAAAG